MVAITVATNHSDFILGSTLPMRMCTLRLPLYVGNNVTFSLHKITMECEKDSSLAMNLTSTVLYLLPSLTKVAVFIMDPKHISTASSNIISNLLVVTDCVRYTTFLTFLSSIWRDQLYCISILSNALFTFSYLFQIYLQLIQIQ